MKRRKETDLYAPIKSFFEKNGFHVKGEVDGCDMVALKDHELVIVEMKTHFNLELILQGINRQTVTDLVYLAVEKTNRQCASRWRDINRLCRKLGLGLLTVSFYDGGHSWVNVQSVPEPYRPTKNQKKHKRIIKEYSARTGDFNQGGCSRRPIMTAYREQALRIAEKLSSIGPCSPKQLNTLLNIPKAASILQKNFYGWFIRVQRGLYSLSPQGEEALRSYADLIHLWKEGNI